MVKINMWVVVLHCVSVFPTATEATVCNITLTSQQKIVSLTIILIMKFDIVL